MGVLYAKVAGSWIPISGNATGDGAVGPPGGSTYVLDPAEAGPRADAVTQARFGNVNEASKRVGFIATTAGQQPRHQRLRRLIRIWDRTADGTSYRARRPLPRATASSGRGGSTTVLTPACAILPTANDPTSGYTILAAYGSTYLKAPTGGSLNFRIGNGRSARPPPRRARSTHPVVQRHRLRGDQHQRQNITTGGLNEVGQHRCLRPSRPTAVNRTGNWAGIATTRPTTAGGHFGGSGRLLRQQRCRAVAGWPIRTATPSAPWTSTSAARSA